MSGKEVANLVVVVDAITEARPARQIMPICQVPRARALGAPAPSCMRSEEAPENVKIPWTQRRQRC